MPWSHSRLGAAQCGRSLICWQLSSSLEWLGLIALVEDATVMVVRGSWGSFGDLVPDILWSQTHLSNLRPNCPELQVWNHLKMWIRIKFIFHNTRQVRQLHSIFTSLCLRFWTIDDQLVNCFFHHSHLFIHCYHHSSEMVRMVHLHCWGNVFVVQVRHPSSRLLTTTSLFTLCLMLLMRPPALSWPLKPTVKVQPVSFLFFRHSTIHHISMVDVFTAKLTTGTLSVGVGGKLTQIIDTFTNPNIEKVSEWKCQNNHWNHYNQPNSDFSDVYWC